MSNNQRLNPIGASWEANAVYTTQSENAVICNCPCRSYSAFDYENICHRRHKNHVLTFPRSVSRSVLPFNIVELELCDEKLLLKVTSRSASGVVTVLARPSTAAFSSYSFLKISSWRASRALIAGSTSPFWRQKKIYCRVAKITNGRGRIYQQFSQFPSS